MRGASHVVFGLAGAVLIANVPPYLAGPSLHASTVTIDHVAEKIVFYGMAALGALAPDIDNARSTLGKRLGFLSRAFQHFAGHRRFFHSLIGMAVVGAVVWAAQYGVGLALVRFGLPVTGDALNAGFDPNGAFFSLGAGIAFAGLMTGYFLHLVADSLTEEGVPWFWPNLTYLGFPPSRHMRFRTGSRWEPVIVVAVAVIVLAAIIFGRINV